MNKMREAIADMFECNTPVAKKPFDISEHEFSDSDITLVHQSNYEVWLDINNSSAMLYKQDAIAIAKALGVTGEDLL